jgi:hypothetical protein
VEHDKLFSTSLGISWVRGGMAVVNYRYQLDRRDKEEVYIGLALHLMDGEIWEETEVGEVSGKHGQRRLPPLY